MEVELPGLGFSSPCLACFPFSQAWWVLGTEWAPARAGQVSRAGTHRGRMDVPALRSSWGPLESPWGFRPLTFVLCPQGSAVLSLLCECFGLEELFGLSPLLSRTQELGASGWNQVLVPTDPGHMNKEKCPAEDRPGVGLEGRGKPAVPRGTGGSS